MKIIISPNHFISELPQLKDYSKITSSIRNINVGFIQLFLKDILQEKYIIMQSNNIVKWIIYMHYQIRYPIAVGDLNGLKSDMSASFFDNGKIAITGPLFREQFDTNEIFIQETHTNKYYCARINKNDIPVLVLL